MKTGCAFVKLDPIFFQKLAGQQRDNTRDPLLYVWVTIGQQMIANNAKYWVHAGE
jgi:hypothetical protein